LHFFSRLVNQRGPDAGQAQLDDLYAHIDHIARVTGMQTVALGPDWLPFHPFGGWTRESGFSFVEGLESIDRLPNLTGCSTMGIARRTSKPSSAAISCAFCAVCCGLNG
jgi:microsomal dipeptidase-like Zn-dependent dipeptidase